MILNKNYCEYLDDNKLHLYLIAYYIFLFICLAYLKSLDQTTEINVNQENFKYLKSVNTILLIFIAIPLIWVVRLPTRCLYLLGASPALGVFPEINFFPFIKEFTHLVMFITLYSLVQQGKNYFLEINKRTKIFFSLWLFSAFSVLLNYALYSDAWQLKVGISDLVLFAVFCGLLLFLDNKIIESKLALEILLRGFLHSIILISIVGIAITIVIAQIPYIYNDPSSGIVMKGANGIGNYTIYGLGYFNRLTLLFPGPVYAGVFFCLGTALTIYHLSLKDQIKNTRILVIIILQAFPWLIMASGSRTAKILLIITLLILCTNRRYRIYILYMMPSVVAALYISFWFNSLPNAINTLISILNDYITIWSNGANATFFGDDLKKTEDLMWMSMKGNFLEDPIRMELIADTKNFFIDSPMVNKVIGIGLGASGYSLSDFPSPHQVFPAILIEIGIVGLVIFLYAIWQLIISLLQVNSCDKNNYDKKILLLLFCLCLFLFSFTYNITEWGCTILIVLLVYLSPSLDCQNILSRKAKL